MWSLSSKTGPFPGQSSDLERSRTNGSAGNLLSAGRRWVLFSSRLFLCLDELVEVADAQLLDLLHLEVLADGLQNPGIALAVLVHNPIDVRLFDERVGDLT